MTKPKRILAIIIVAIAFVAILYGVRSIRLSNLDDILGNKEAETYASGLTAENIPAIDDPEFVSVSVADSDLADVVYGIDVEVDGQHRFYSFQILNWHAVVNDEFGDKTLAVTYCTFCRSAVVYEREVDGTEMAFEISGNVQDNNIILTDRETGRMWDQMTGDEFNGDAALVPYPSQVMTWENWKEQYPYGEAMSINTGYTRDYTRHPYADYDTSDMVYFPLSATSNNVSQKWIVNGLDLNGEQMAFANMIMRGFGAVNETVGGTPVVGLYNFDTAVTKIFNRNAEGQDLTFEYSFETELIVDVQTGSTWNANGYALSGELQGTQLVELHTPESFWLCWYAAHPETAISQIDPSGEID
ncbi:MAG: DUF3179 domain-containing (seleno)protein [bacterium]